MVSVNDLQLILSHHYRCTVLYIFCMAANHQSQWGGQGWSAPAPTSQQQQQQSVTQGGCPPLDPPVSDSNNRNDEADSGGPHSPGDPIVLAELDGVDGEPAIEHRLFLSEGEVAEDPETVFPVTNSQHGHVPGFISFNGRSRGQFNYSMKCIIINY